MSPRDRLIPVVIAIVLGIVTAGIFPGDPLIAFFAGVGACAAGFTLGWLVVERRRA